MNPDEKIKKLEQIIDDMRNGRDIVLLETLRRRALYEAVKAGVKSDPSVINQSVGGLAAFTSPKEFDKKVLTEIDGEMLYIGVYTI